MKTRSQTKLAAAAADAPTEQPFRFLDLPKELRLMVYEELMDNNKNSIKFTAPRHLHIFEVHAEYWAVCLRRSTLWIIYTCNELSPGDDDSSVGIEPTIPLLSEWIEIPVKVLVRIAEVIFKFVSEYKFPDISPFSGIADCTTELLSLKCISIWAELEASTIENGSDEAERVEDFDHFVTGLFLEECELYHMVKKNYRKFEGQVYCDMHVPLYEMNKNYCWPRSRHLQQGVAPLPGLPEWGYSLFEVRCPWDEVIEDSFTYHGLEVAFKRVEYSLPVPDRAELDCGSSASELDYEFDESGWATGNMPGRG